MRIALKLEYCADTQIFRRLQSKLNKFKERAGFSMTSSPPRRMKNTHTSLPWSYTYMYSNPTAICIISWVEDPNPSLPATWRYFLQILREPGMDLCDLADQIEHKLEFTRNLQVLQESNCELILLHEIVNGLCLINGIYQHDCIVYKLYVVRYYSHVVTLLYFIYAWHHGTSVNW